MRDRLLTRLFLQRFVDNDLISPDADRHQTLAVVCSALVTSGLFVTVFLSLKFLFQPFESPGHTAIVALEDRVFYVAYSMILMALLAVATWDALALDWRDAAILGPLPVARTTVVKAKVVAVALFAGGCDVVLNMVSSILQPLPMASKLSLGVLEIAFLIVVYALVTTAAGAFGFLAVVALREGLTAVLGQARFNRFSAIAQGSLVVVLSAPFLLLPTQPSAVKRLWAEPGVLTPYVVPPLWFLGMQETLAGGVVDRLPRRQLPAGMLELEIQSTAMYRSRQPRFRNLAGVAVVGLGIAMVVALGGYVSNSRHLAAPNDGSRAKANGPLSMLARIVRSTLARRPIVQAGYFFALQSVSRSRPHRMAIATSFGVGLAVAIVSLRGLDMRHSADISSLPLAWLALQTSLVIALLVGFRYTVRLPADVRANWTFRLTWPGHESAYLIGVKRAASLGMVVPTLLALAPLHVRVLGSRLAVAHFAIGLLVGLLCQELLFMGFRQVPFASSYVPTGNLSFRGPLYVLDSVFCDNVRNCVCGEAVR